VTNGTRRWPREVEGNPGQADGVHGERRWRDRRGLRGGRSAEAGRPAAIVGRRGSRGKIRIEVLAFVTIRDVSGATGKRRNARNTG